MPLPAQIGNYRLERELGRGASSEVWLARHSYLGDHTVAIKVLMSQEREAVRRFKREAAIAARLHHPNIVQLLDYGQCDPFFYAVMELIEGQSLRDILAARDHLSLTDATAIFTQIAEALEYAHTHGIVHRDVSPANILIEDQTRRALLSDFGIARDASQPITQADAIMGTSGYHSPEHAQSAASVTHLSDIFSLGVVLYHMLSGQLPWHNVPSLTDKDEFSPPVPLAERGVEGVPPEVDRVLRTMLALDPNDRYPTAALPAAELRQIIARHQTKTQRIGAVPIITRPVELQASGVEPNPIERILAPDLAQATMERTHRRAEELRDPASLAALLDQWAAEDRWRRTPLLGRLARLHKIVSRNVYFYRLRVLYERREPPEDDEEPDREAEVFPVERELAPWDVPLPSAESFTDNPGGRVHLPGSTRVVACQPCAGKGFAICPRCQGRQRIPAPSPSPSPSSPQPARAPASRPPASASRPPASRIPASSPPPSPADYARELEDLLQTQPPASPPASSPPASPASSPHPSSLIPHPSSPTPHPSSLIPHPSSPTPHPSSLIPHPSSLIPCPECSGRGGIICKRCTGIGRLVQRKVVRWHRHSDAFNTQDDLPFLDEDWLARTCRAELVYRERQVGGTRPEWQLIPAIAELIKQAEAPLDSHTRITLSELSISLIPITDIVFDLGQTNDSDLYRLTIYGFENLIPPDWRFFNWERVVMACIILFLLVIVCVLLVFALI
ncbi:serine/threonine-protein kinase [Candidatus Viridilinea mediisalina]|uniref:non-specific serine/threonine protein kinase n=1 Tax=Candidatus Viridilinea mediisalina TaxID=2024553 RepID=A0A2A6RJ69_9CHLR|nr:serine/threonine-protein kinase [Candidatus Viridilinea mediisalina]PDW03174.1 hypothetical protein CJ255_10195 [Candidatus Viridilinea mediisalina]